MSDTAVIRREPTDADINSVITAARDAVEEMAAADGALGHAAIEEGYVRSVWAAIIAREVKGAR